MNDWISLTALASTIALAGPDHAERPRSCAPSTESAPRGLPPPHRRATRVPRPARPRPSTRRAIRASA